ncbi:MAG: nucleoside deaminase [Desulfobulbaceae bacterium]|nr:nucleoside deaminase [Desulfobulbaceae bacterium]
MAATISSFMAEAVKLSEHGMFRGDGGPFGAVIVREGKIIGKGWNRVLATNDPTAHAEITAIRDACRATSSYRLEGCTIYVNCEPCPMCLAAIYWAGIEQILFAATREDAERIGFIDAELYREICRPDQQRSIKTAREDKKAALKIMQQWPTLDGHHDY